MTLPSTRALVVLAVVGALMAPVGGVAQTFEGRVMDDRTEAPVPGALVRLVDGSGQDRSVAIADSSGAYRIEAPGPGVYSLEAARIGFENFQTPPLEVASQEGRYRIDLLLRVAPVELPGFTVETNRLPDEVVDQAIRLMIGLSPSSLRYQPIRLEEIQRHAEQGHRLSDVLRWSGGAGLIVQYTTDGPCFSLRSRGCLSVYLNGLQLNRDFMGEIPLDLLSAIVVVTPTDGTMAYPGGAVLLYTDAWLR